MELYIGNTTKKTQIFLYRRPGSERPNDFMQMEIPPGGQNRVPVRDLSQPQIDAIVNHHAKYGLRSVEEITRTHRGRYIGMCYSIDKPVPLERLQLGIQHNDEILVQFGEDLRQAAAVVTAQAIEQHTGRALAELEVSVEEENIDRHSGDGDALGKQTVVVTREAPEKAPIKTVGAKARARGR